MHALHKFTVTNIILLQSYFVSFRIYTNRCRQRPDLQPTWRRGSVIERPCVRNWKFAPVILGRCQLWNLQFVTDILLKSYLCWALSKGILQGDMPQTPYECAIHLDLSLVSASIQDKFSIPLKFWYMQWVSWLWLGLDFFTNLTMYMLHHQPLWVLNVAGQCLLHLTHFDDIFGIAVILATLHFGMFCFDSSNLHLENEGSSVWDLLTRILHSQRSFRI